jgi:hypothetical protein
MADPFEDQFEGPFGGMCCQIALDQCNKIYEDSLGRCGWEPTVCPHDSGAAKLIGEDPYRNGGGGGTHTNCDAYDEYCLHVRFAPGGWGYESAKESFQSEIKNLN